MSIQRIIIALIVGYAFGNIPNGYLYAKARGVDIYKVGSGNPGSTNVLRTLGKKAGATVLLMDIAKTILPILILRLVWNPADPGERGLIAMFAGLGAILGHNYPCIPGLKGGKGVACTGALCIAFDWRLAVVLLTLFVLIVVFTGYVSLGSMIACSCFFLSVLLLGRTGLLPVTASTYPLCCILSFLIAALCIYQHRANIQRLRNGTENRFGKKKN